MNDARMRQLDPLLAREEQAHIDAALAERARLCDAVAIDAAFAFLAANKRRMEARRVAKAVCTAIVLYQPMEWRLAA